VFLWKGCAIDAPNRSVPRFPASRVGAVEKAVGEILEKDWKLGKGDLAICGGATESDVIFAEACLRLGARVRLMLLRPERGGLSPAPDKRLWPFADTTWRSRFQRLLSHEHCQTWFDTDHLGSALDGFSHQNIEEFLTRRHNQWLINTAEMEAEPTTTPGGKTDNGPTRLHGLFLVTPHHAEHDAAEVAFLMHRVNEFDGYRGDVKTIDPNDDCASTSPETRPGKRLAIHTSLAGFSKGSSRESWRY
jgi:hypothetical protein